MSITQKTSSRHLQQTPHLALLPSSGMGHLAPFCCLAAALCGHGCEVSFITANPTVSDAESLHTYQLISSYPQIHSLNLPLVQLDLSTFPSTADPFFLRFEAIRHSSHLLPPLLTSLSPSPTAFIIDITLASSYLPVARAMNLPCYILFTSSAAMLSLCAFFPTYIATKSAASGIDDITIPGLWTLPKASVAPPLHNPNHLFTTQFIQNGQILVDADGILINTFKALEPNTLAALNGGQVVSNLPPVITVGPFKPLHPTDQSLLPWLNTHPLQSVVYVSFGSRTAMSREQINELAVGLEKSQCRFLWVIKTKIVDKEEEVELLEELVGDGFVERVKGRGFVVNGWVKQEEILNHGAVGGFVSHCGWNSVSEAAMSGKRMLGWPRIGDQRVNAEVVRSSGLGIWMEEWGWEAEDRVVNGEEIGKKVKEMMEDEELKQSAERVKEEAVKAAGLGGSSWKGLEEFIGRFGPSLTGTTQSSFQIGMMPTFTQKTSCSM